MEKKAAGKKKEGRSMHSSISPVDHRYRVKEVADHLSPESYTAYLCRVECALADALCASDLCNKRVAGEIIRACVHVTADEVAAEEARIGHDIRALVNCIKKRVSDSAKPFVHMTATSYDVIDTARALQYRDVFTKVVIPEFIALETTLIDIALREADTVQIGRTHGQHAVPITFGFAVANYVNRLGESILHMQDLTRNLRGKFSGAVGAYNASSLFSQVPEKFEEEVLAELRIGPALCSSQITPPEPLMRLLSEAITAAGIVANIARDMRHLQRSEIDEVAEEFGDAQVGSSTMAHKKNPISFENIESLWKVLVGRMVTMYMDQISEHQRDLTNSASMRTYPEIVNYVVYMTRRLNRTMKKLRLDHESIARNLEAQSHLIAAEPLYLLLAAYGHPDAHEAVRRLSMRAREEKAKIEEVAAHDPDIKKYLDAIPAKRKKVLHYPSRTYTGISGEKARKVAGLWAEVFKIPLQKRR